MPQGVFAEETMQFGFAKVDVTPTEPVRLSGYGNRDKPLEGIDEQLYARAMAMQSGNGKVHLLVAVACQTAFPGCVPIMTRPPSKLADYSWISISFSSPT